MRQKFLTPSLTVLALLTLIVVFAGPVVVTPESSARPAAECEGSFLTAEEWGHGATCNEATQDLYNRVFALAEERCGVGNVCNAALVITLGCPNPNDGSIMADGQLHHGCLDPSSGQF